MTIASRRLENAENLVKNINNPNCVACSVNVNDDDELGQLISQHDLVVSLIPYTYHAKVIEIAIKHKKNVVTTSYVNPHMQALDEKAKQAGITCMNEIGLDPGIDHLYAIKMIEDVHKEGGKIMSFLSFCGGLPAPECSNNPLGYKFSWSSRGVLLALRNQAKFLDNGKQVVVEGKDLMKSAKRIHTGYPAYAFVGYGNRDSTPYSQRYRIPEAQDIIRGSLRYEGYPEFVQVLVDMGFLDDKEVDYLSPSTASSPLPWSQLSAKLVGAAENMKGDQLLNAVLEKTGVSSMNAETRDRIVHGLKWLGILSEKPVTKRGTLLDTLCATLEEKMSYGKNERDMIFLQHKFIVELANGKKETRFSTLVEYGVPGGYMAMAKTVGIPCGIAIQSILDGKLTQTGVLAPMTMDICGPIIEELEKEGIGMIDEIIG